MKKLITNLKRTGLTVICIVVLGTLANAQVCGPVWPDVTVGSGSTSISHTGNDVAYNGCDWLRVQVYDGTNPGISWQTNDYCTGNGFNASSSPFALNDAIDPDVVLVQDQVSATWYAIAVYYSPNAGRYFFNPWKYTGSGFVDLGPVTIDGASMFGSSINIDANGRGDFVIVWDNANASVIRSVGGYTDAGVGPYLCGGFTNLPNTTGGYNSPDVAVAENTSGGQGAAYIHYVYTYPANYKILVTMDKQWYICNNLPNFIPEWGAAISNPGDAFVEPRIACPNAYASTIRDWSVVWLYIDNTNSSYDVQGATKYFGSITTHVYTDGSEIGLPCPQGFHHKRPCVAYSGYNTSPQDGIQISWTTDWSCITSSTTIIGLQLDVKGFVMPGSCYQIAPQSVPPKGQDISSLAGRHSKFMTSCYWDFNNVNDVLTKDYFWFTGFRKGETPAEETKVSITPNPSHDAIQLNVSDLAGDKEYSLVVTDLSGKTILAITGIAAEIKASGENSISSLATGVYLVRIFSSDQGQVLNEKIVRY